LGFSAGIWSERVFGVWDLSLEALEHWFLWEQQQQSHRREMAWGAIYPAEVADRTTFSRKPLSTVGKMPLIAVHKWWGTRLQKHHKRHGKVHAKTTVRKQHPKS